VTEIEWIEWKPRTANAPVGITPSGVITMNHSTAANPQIA
jgi:hypothetical protein